ncbi:MAG: 4Fe-4S cluster-binding domain-containing protein [Treponema sp.]|nr:4Fe-4S cluster-binding domain-containing protein [Treponema sp.]
MEQKENRFYPSICVTHDCNLSCVYCYQKHNDKLRMSLQTGRNIIDWIFENVSSQIDGVEITFIGGEPLLEFELIRDIFDYTLTKDIQQRYIFYATTNGTILTDEMKKWFTSNKKQFYLGLSLDGKKETHDYNRCNSFDLIDIDFFKNTWPDQGVKMTLSEYSLQYLADDIQYIHSLGFKDIAGVNLFEGDFDWSHDKYIKLLISQLKKIVDFYKKNPDLNVNQMLDKRLDFCEMQTAVWRQKWCGIGDATVFFDVDGEKYPCYFITPMTFSHKEINKILKTDFTIEDNFIDEECYKHCYIYPICPTCSGANYMVYKTFKIRNKTKCKIQKLIALFIADLQAKRLLNSNKKMQDDNILYYTIEAIKNIRKLYFDELKNYL